jgi:hypothetical protein
MVAIDGMQPEKGNDCLYVLREPRLGLTLLAESLEDSTAPTLQHHLLAPLKALAQRLKVPILGVVSDAQESIRLAVAAELPGIAHHTCHFHCLRDAGSITFETDRSLKTALKKALRRPLASLEGRIQRLPESDPFRPILADYADAIRSTLLEGGVAPFALGGVRVFDDLADLATSLIRCQEKGGILCWIGSCALPIAVAPLPRNGINWLDSGSGSSTWIGCSTRLSRRLTVPLWPKTSTATWPSYWTRSTPRTMNSTSRLPPTSTASSGIAGGVCSSVIKSKACPVPTTSWKRSYGDSRPVSVASPVASRFMTSSSATVGLWPFSILRRAKAISCAGSVRWPTMTLAASEYSSTAFWNEQPGMIAFVTGESSFYNNWKRAGRMPKLPLSHRRSHNLFVC